MDQHGLAAFLAVADHSSFSRAADSLHLTQPAVSKRIAALEESLGHALFDRLGRRTTLTEAGRTLLPRARTLVLEIDDVRRLLDNLNAEVTGHLAMGTSHHIGLHRLPPVLRRYSTDYPAVTLDIDFIDSEEAFDAVLEGKQELGVVTLPPKADPRVKCLQLWRDPLRIMVSHDHPLAQEKTVSLRQLTHHPAILPSAATFTRRIVEEVVARKKLHLNVAIATNYLETLKMMTAVGLGWSVLPEAMADDQLKMLDVPELHIERELGCVMHPHRSLSNAAQKMLALLIAAADENRKEG